MKRVIYSFSFSPYLNEALIHYAETSGRSKSNAAEHLLRLALKVPPMDEPEDIRLAKLTGGKVNRNIYFPPTILARVLKEADRLDRPVSHVVSRALFDHYQMTYDDL
jgi:hypothetical protein